MKKIMIVFGTRPEAIKMVPIIKQIEKEADLKGIICTTGQHKDMLTQVLEEFDIKADYNLDIMQKEQTITYITTKVIEKMSEIIEREKPSIVLVHGDTTTSFGTAIGAFYSKVKIGHVEAGLRTYNKYSPFPEEVNRRLIANLADLHFAPTQENKENLIKENIPEKNIFVTGNTIIDTMHLTIKKDYIFKNEIIKNIDFSNDKKYILLTAHRRENQEGQIKNICKAVNKLVKENSKLEVIFPVHYSPKVRREVYETLLESNQIHLLEPINTHDMHNLLSRIDLVLTDSGGLQEEAPTIGKKVLVLRNNTERPEALKTGLVEIIGTETENIVATTKKYILEDTNKKGFLENNPYGDGKASEKIAKILQKY